MGQRQIVCTSLQSRPGSPFWRHRLTVLFLTLAALIAPLNHALSQSSSLLWRWSNPKPHGNNIIDMAVSGGLYIQVTEKGRIYTSQDLDSWTPQPSPTRKSLRAVTFFNERIVITGESGAVVTGPSADDLSVIDLDTIDWIEGVAASSSLVVAVGDNGAVYTSPDGTSWQRQSQPFSHWLRDITYASNQFVAVGENGFIGTSTDGTTWQEQDSGTTTFLNDILWDGSQFVAAGSEGQVLTSSDAQSWQLMDSGTTNSLYTSASSPDGLMVAGANEVRLNAGTGWTDEIRRTDKELTAPNWTYLSSLWDGSLVLLGGRTGMIVEGFKTNSTGQTVWVDRDESVRNWLWDLTRASGYYVAVGDRATVMTSDNGLDWELELVPDALTNTVFLGVGGTSNLTVAVGNHGAAMTSTNGVVWDAQSTPTDNDLQGVAVFDGRFFVSGGGGTILSSPDAASWTAESTPTSVFLSGIDASPDRLVATGNEGTILSSPDGQTWTAQDSGTTEWIYGVRYLNGRFIAVGQNGTLLTSPDGSTWTLQTSGTTRWLNAAIYLDGHYYVAGNQGTLLQSPNGSDWSNIGTITPKSLFGLASNNGKLVTVGTEGVILRSQVIPHGTPVTIESFSRESGRNAFLFAGEPDQRFTLESSPDLQSWSHETELEIFDSSGTLIYIQQPDGNSPQNFYRTIPRTEP